MKVLVTGAGGYIGRFVVQELLNKGAEVLACDINPAEINPRARLLDVNILDGADDIYHKTDRPDICIHLAWKDGFNHNAPSHMGELSRHYFFLENIIKGGLSQLVVMGSMHEIGYHEGVVDEKTPCAPSSMYGIAKDALRRSAFLLSTGITLQWLRAFYIYGDDARNQSIFTKLLKAEEEKKATFPFNTGKNKYDFIHVEELARQISAVAMQKDISGIINCCSGKPIALADMVETFIKERNMKIRLEYGVFPDRPYDSPAIWGSDEKIRKIKVGM